MNRAAYLYEQLQAQLLAGDFGVSGDLFPTVRTLSKEYSCSFRCAMEVIQRLWDSRLLRPMGQRYCITTGVCHPATAYGKYLSESDRTLFGVLLGDSSNPFFGALADHLRDAVYSSGGELIIASSGGDLRRERQILDMFAELKCRGVFSCVPVLPEQRELFLRYPLPVVFLAEDPHLSQIDSVLVDNRAAGKQVANHLLDCGCPSFAYITAEDHVEQDLRLQGFREQLLQRGILLPEENIGILPGIGTDTKDFTGFVHSLLDRMGKQANGPVGIFCEHDLLAVEVMGAVRRYRRKKYQIPEDIMVVGFDDLPVAPLVHPGLTTVSYRYSAIAKKAYAVMADRLANPEHRAVRLEVSSSLTVRGSTRPCV